jgi:hypothetical protein
MTRPEPRRRLDLNAFVAVYFWLWKRYVIARPVRMVLGELTHFDRLAYDEYRAAPLRGWELLPEYGART